MKMNAHEYVLKAALTSIETKAGDRFSAGAFGYANEAGVVRSESANGINTAQEVEGIDPSITALYPPPTAYIR